MACAAWAGTTPLPSRRSCAVREMASPVTHPTGRPIRNSTNSGARTGWPRLPISSGCGARRPRACSHRASAAPCTPHRKSAVPHRALPFPIIRSAGGPAHPPDRGSDPVGRVHRFCSTRSGRLMCRRARSASAAGSAGPSERGQASRNTRSRRCGAPTSSAQTLRHDESYPVAARSPSTRPRPPPRHRRAATFSTTSSWGRTTRTAPSTSVHSPLRSPFSTPALRPAAEMSWQGNPAVRISTRRSRLQSSTRMSPRFGTPAKRALRTLTACGSTSEHQLSWHPGSADMTPISSPPTPEHSDPIVIGRVNGSTAAWRWREVGKPVTRLRGTRRHDPSTAPGPWGTRRTPCGAPGRPRAR